MAENLQTALKGLKVASFESRREREMAALIERYGGEPIVAPSMRELPLEQNAPALDFMRELKDGKIDLVLFLTGVGARTLIDAISTRYRRDELIEALKKVPLVARGPKPVAVLKELGLTVEIAIPEPNTWREVLAELKKVGLRGKRIAVQEYGITKTELAEGLRSLGAEVLLVPVYRWAMPENIAPLKSAVREIAAGRVDVALFTNATQIEHLLRVAGDDGFEDKLREGLSRAVVASIGPVCTEALTHYGFAADIEPEHPKMGHLIAAVAERARTLLKEKRKAHS
jgi:uroporphyrinogen-III synthase